MNSGRLLAAILGAATVAFIAIGTIWPSPAAAAYAGAASILRPSSTPQAAVENLGDQIRARDWGKAYNSLANKAQFTQTQFEHDVTGAYPNLLSYSTLSSYEARPLHGSDNDAEVRLILNWATVVGNAVTERDLHVVKNGDRWQAEWPVVKDSGLPAQVISVDYLRWDVIYRGAGDDWGAQDVEAPHVRIVDMQPIERAEGVVIMGELLNEDVVPAYVSVNATLLAKDKTVIASEGSFDRISHLLLPKQVTPFLIRFPHVSLSSVASVRMDPSSALVAASADPVITIADQALHPVPDPSLTGELINTSGQIVNVAHVLGTFYDKSGQVVWVADQYVDQALLPGTPVPFRVPIPEDLAKNVATQRTVISTYMAGGTQ